MGLSGRKVKQRIPTDPRNLTWAEDPEKFSSKYLLKFGWDSSQGLGVNGDGRITQFKLAPKLDLLGIGSAHQNYSKTNVDRKQKMDLDSVLLRLCEAELSSQDKITGGEETSFSGSERNGTKSVALRKRKYFKVEEEACDSCTKYKRIPSDKRDVLKFQPAEVNAVQKRRVQRPRIMVSQNTPIAGVGGSEAQCLCHNNELETINGPPYAMEIKMSQHFRISSKSIADYFREKLAHKKN